MCISVVAKKLVFQLRFSLSWHHFCMRPGTQFSFSIFCNALNAGLPSFTFTRWQMQYMEREHAKQVLKTRFYFNYCTHFNGMILKVVRSLLSCSRKYPYPPHGKVFSLDPHPLWKFHFGTMLSFKKLGF